MKEGRITLTRTQLKQLKARKKYSIFILSPSMKASISFTSKKSSLRTMIFTYHIPHFGESIFVSLRSNIDIDTILCIKKKRKTDASSCFSFKGRLFKIDTQGYPLVPARKEIEVLLGPRVGMKVCYKDQVYEAVQYLKPERKDANLIVRPKVKKAVQPHLVHSSDKWKEIWHSEPYVLEKKLQTMYVVGRDGTRYLISPKPGSKVASSGGRKTASVR
jgi:hypothetical protein